MDSPLQALLCVEGVDPLGEYPLARSRHKDRGVRRLAGRTCDERPSAKPCEGLGDRFERFAAVDLTSSEHVVVLVPLVGLDQVLKNGQAELVNWKGDDDG